MTAIVTQGDARNLLLPDECVDLLVTSPPYFGLRSYQDNGAHYLGQIGDEATPAEYLDALIACTAEWQRVLKPGGSIFVNLGDKYSGAQQQNSGKQSATSSADYWKRTNPKSTGIPAKSLMMLPQRYAIRCIDELGLILRAEIIWSKPNGLPESVTDRVRRSHEQVFHFVKQPRYYEAVDEVREPHAREWTAGSNGGKARASVSRVMAGLAASAPNALGALPGSVWEIATAPLKVPASLGIDHFAAYPPELVRRIVLGWSPREVCTGCGEGRRPVVSKTRTNGARGVVVGAMFQSGERTKTADGKRHEFQTEATITGYACACPAPLVARTIEERDEATGERVVRIVPVPDLDWTNPAPTTPGVVVDPFGGTGTTALVASCFGRVGISVDLSADYCRLARWRTTDPGERARVLGVPKPPAQIDGQLGMFDGEAAS